MGITVLAPAESMCVWCDCVVLCGACEYLCIKSYECICFETGMLGCILGAAISGMRHANGCVSGCKDPASVYAVLHLSGRAGPRLCKSINST